MAKKEQNIMLLQEVVGQLRKLNAQTVRDRLREAEEAKRAESLLLKSEEQIETEGLVVDSSEDFRRRFIAGQAKTFADSKLTKTGGKTRDLTRNDILKDINASIIGLHDPRGKGALGGDLDIAGVGEKVLAVHDSIVNDSLWVLINDNRLWRADQLQNFNTQQRIARENRIEGTKLGGGGAGVFGTGGIPGMDGDLGDEGFFDENTMGNIKAVGFTSLTAGIGAALIKFRKWFGFGTKKGFAKTMVQRFRIAGKRLFKGRKLTAKQTGMLKNPRLWPLITAGLLVASFVGATDEIGEAEVDLDQSQFNEDDGIFGTGIDGGTILSTALWASILTPNKLKTRIATAIKAATTAAFSAAKPGTLRARMWATRLLPKSPFSLLKGGIRFLGPLGLAAWATWTFVSWRMEENEKAMAAADQAAAEIRAIDSEAGFEDFFTNDARFNAFKYKGDKGVPGAFAGQNAAKKLRNARIMESVKQLYMNRSLQEREWITKGLIEHGDWTADELKKVQVMADNQERKDYIAKAYPNLSNRAKVQALGGNRGDGWRKEQEEKLKLLEEEKIRKLGDGPHGGVLITGNNGDTYSYKNSHFYVQGFNEISAELWTGKQGFAPR
jgi:hypothetical protein